ncbi:polyprenyl synthetase family protein [Anaerosalibacter bizertensis]|uniref:Farnesyl diphosphate synthase n=1 Tax=Anaerosalibacter bizertensis TaxID=932217 RepID=A0A844FFY1_9FIRM|nr:farnesyl diphosphate synthase [Anaerosalibacter bizertensis]MBV1817396.1 polyprenyl synthetase family protein [Bacteroidales bacterium MSK.15.36]HHV26213.1 polyprenyl synthetase family protein [Tissierellia bacterium]MBU5293171.1 polyprenyl synthetase family protein [Anaerosalibacter bizertensis]MCB5558476.1 polyprenyl synthetase family protein [Anaerosalibacter bizertensis]MCG4564240.1 polyprenyl synthetase family protein [Anaerosalibacter bizertensis]
MSLIDEIDHLKEVIDDELNRIFVNKTGYQEKIFQAMKYSLFTGGKRIRPILLLKSCEMISGSYDEAIPFALALEMIHTYSLIHDDLPSMDDDDFRRGKPTNHKIFGEAIAILSGDGLLNLAYEIMIENTILFSKNREDYYKFLLASKEISKASGIDGMIGGQVVDILSDSESIDSLELEFMYRCKTAALIEAAVVSGGIIGGANEIEIDNLRKYGRCIGLGYQIRDDILDIDEDRAINKTTYLSFNSLETAKEKVEYLSKEAKLSLEIFKDNNITFLEEIAYYLINRNK